MPSLTAYLTRRAQQLGLDPRAVLAVASVEGGLRTGAVGDQGTSYGPFQLHRGGALPAGKGAAWANSPAGLDYALQRMAASGARGKSGRAAVEAIVRNFERPANPGAEIQKALGHYGKSNGTSWDPTPAPTNSQVDSSVNPKQALALALIQANQQTGQGRQPDYTNVFSALRSANQPQASTAPPALAGNTGARKGSLEELFYDPLGAIKRGQRIPAIGGHDDHVHIAAGNPQSMVAAMDQARRMGLRVSENPYVGQVHQVHVQNSNHYRVIGQANGRKIGGAADVSGSPSQMAAYFKWAAANL